MLWLRVYSASQGLDSAGGVGGGTLFAGEKGREGREVESSERASIFPPFGVSAPEKQRSLIACLLLPGLSGRKRSKEPFATLRGECRFPLGPAGEEKKKVCVARNERWRGTTWAEEKKNEHTGRSSHKRQGLFRFLFSAQAALRGLRYKFFVLPCECPPFLFILSSLRGRGVTKSLGRFSLWFRRFSRRVAKPSLCVSLQKQ